MESINYSYELSGDEFENFEERAAIMEFNGGLSRNEAEREAFAIILHGRNPVFEFMLYWNP